MAINHLLDHPLEISTGAFLLTIISYILYQRYLHPLAKYPGPFLASLTDLWQVHQFMTLKQPYNLTKVHEKHGSIVRYGPDKLSITDEEAIKLIYQSGAKFMPKTEFYDAYGAAHTNIFGMRDESAHSIRRRHMSHSFSISYVKEMEQYLDANIKILRGKISEYIASNQTFDLKKALHYYVIDALGELAFSQTFGIQVSDDESVAPPVIEHSLLAAVTGAWPMMTARLKRWLPLIPHKGLNALFDGRKVCADLASRCVDVRLNAVRNSGDSKASSSERKDILTNLINAKHPDTGEHLTQTDLETEAFGFMCVLHPLISQLKNPHRVMCHSANNPTLYYYSIAGTHTTSATTTLLFYHLLHHPDLMAKCVAEIDTNLPPLQEDEGSYSVSAAESSLPYLKNCMKENFRVTPVFTMPLARRVLKSEGIIIAGKHIPYGTSIAVCNHAFHHNPDVFGVDHNVFDPTRWDQQEIANKSKLLMHFGLGGRQCIGKTVAMTNIYKLMSTLLSEFEFELADEKERDGPSQNGSVGDVPELISVGISDLARPLLVKASKRTRVSS